MATIALQVHNTIALNDREVYTFTAVDTSMLHRVNILNIGAGAIWFVTDRAAQTSASIGGQGCELLPALVADNGVEFDKSISVISDGASTVVIRMIS